MQALKQDATEERSWGALNLKANVCLRLLRSCVLGCYYCTSSAYGGGDELETV